MRKPRTIIIVTLCLLALDCIGYLLLSQPTRAPFVDGLEFFLQAACAVGCAIAARHSHRLARNVWILTGLFFFFLALGDLQDFSSWFFPHSAFLGSWLLDYVFWFCTLPLALTIFLPSEKTGRSGWDVESLLDFLQVAVVLAFAYYCFIYLPHLVLGINWTAHNYPKNLRNAVISVGLLVRSVVDPVAEIRRLYRWIGVVYAGVSLLVAVYGLPGGIFPIYPIGQPTLSILLVIFAVTWRQTPVSKPLPKESPSNSTGQFLLKVLPVLGPVLVLFIAQRVPPAYQIGTRVALWTSLLVLAVRMGVKEMRHQRASQALSAAEARFRQIVSSSPLPMWVFDRQTLKFLEVNDTAIRDYGYSREEFLSMKATEIRLPEDSTTAQEIFDFPNYKPRNRIACRHRLKNGTIIECEVETQVIEFGGRLAELVIAVDVTQRKHLEAQLLHSQKMEAIGLLAGGVAHDFNNLLTVIIGYCSILLSRTPRDPDEMENLEQIQYAANRASSLTRQLLTFSRKQLTKPEPVLLNDLIGHMEKMLERLIGEDVRLETRLQHNLWLISADPAHIEQIIMNLAVNAREAMPSGGLLRFQTSNVEPLNGEERRVRIDVSDSGIGMSEDVRARIFEPFFTTKKETGTGLGLSTVYAIVDQMKGMIDVQSQPGVGTTFSIYLPVMQKAFAGETAAKPLEYASGNGESILLVEDEVSVRKLIKSALEASGYKVCTAESADHAFDMISSSHFDLLITDVVMPAMSGPQLVSKILLKVDRLRVIFISGYTYDSMAKHGLKLQPLYLLQKPFTTSDLIGKVQHVLEAPPSLVLD
jgi:two-component system cell cycle sensor histidine kinase/response regulator CckA